MTATAKTCLGRIVPVLLIAALAVSACGRKDEERILFDGYEFKAKSDNASKDDRKMFTVSVKRADQSIQGALEAGRHEGKSYCLKNYGTSEIAWTRGPDDPGAAAYVDGNRLTLSGTCVLW